jgi:hypothetical protein
MVEQHAVWSKLLTQVQTAIRRPTVWILAAILPQARKHKKTKKAAGRHFPSRVG